MKKFLKELWEDLKAGLENTKEMYVDGWYEVKMYWFNYDLTKYNIVGKVIIAPLITVANIIISVYALVLALALPILILLIAVLAPFMWLLFLVCEGINKLLLKKQKVNG